MDSEWENECPFCRTHRDDKPSLIMRYSKCCGLPMCEECVSSKFKEESVVLCENCNQKLTRKKFSKDTLTTQKFKRESENRAKVNKIMNLRRSDFHKLEDFNDFLEESEDITYELTFGNTSERQAANARLQTFLEKHGDLIQKNKNRTVDDELEALHAKEAKEREKGKDFTAMNTANDGNGTRWNDAAAQRVLQKMLANTPRVIDDGENPIIPEGLRRNPKKLKERRAKAGGSGTRFWKTRDKKEAFAGLMDFHET